MNFLNVDTYKSNSSIVKPMLMSKDLFWLFRKIKIQNETKMSSSRKFDEKYTTSVLYIINVTILEL